MKNKIDIHGPHSRHCLNQYHGKCIEFAHYIVFFFNQLILFFKFCILTEVSLPFVLLLPPLSLLPHTHSSSISTKKKKKRAGLPPMNIDTTWPIKLW